MSSLQLKEIITKLGTLHKTMKERSISYDHSWIGDLQKLNQKIHNLFQGDVIPPDFLNGYYFTNEVVLQTHKTEVGLILENYYDAVGDVVPEESFYQPKLGNFQKVSLSELTRGDRSIIDQEKVS